MGEYQGPGISCRAEVGWNSPAKSLLTQRLLVTSDSSLGRKSNGIRGVCVRVCVRVHVRVCVVLGRAAVGAERQREPGLVQVQNPQGPFVCFQQTFMVRRPNSSKELRPAGPSVLEFSQGY